MSVDLFALRALLDAAPDGVTICSADGDYPLEYTNRAMEILTGYPSGEMLGRNLRFLHGEDRDQEGLTRMRHAMSEGLGCQAMLRNYRRDGTQFWNEMTLIPLRDHEGVLTHYAAFHRDGSERQRSEVRPAESDPALNTLTMLAFVREDKLTGLLRKPYFEELLKRDWGLAQRDSRALTIFVMDLDYFKPYQDVFGRSGADQCFRRISRVVSGCFRRASDLCGRYGEDQIIALTSGMHNTEAKKFGESLLARVRDLAIHHPRSNISRYITASIGIATCVPPPNGDSLSLIQEALRALRYAKDSGRNRVHVKE